MFHGSKHLQVACWDMDREQCLFVGSVPLHHQHVLQVQSKCNTPTNILSAARLTLLNQQEHMDAQYWAMQLIDCLMRGKIPKCTGSS